MKYIRFRVWIIFALIVIGVIVVLNYTTQPEIYKSSSPVTDSLLTASYPDLYDAISDRDADSLKLFLTHEHPEVQDQAWRALANTPVDSLSPFIELAKQQNTEAAWFGISQKDLTDEQLRNLEQSWRENPGYRFGINRVLGKQGDEYTLDFLLDQLDGVDPGNEYQFALAIGRLVNLFDVNGDEQIRIIQNAFSTENYDATRAYLYGWYRGDESKLTSIAQNTLFNRWLLLGTGISRNVDQYVNKILPERTTYRMTIYYNGEQMLDHEVQLAYELATSVEKIELNSQNALAAKILLTNTNPHVQVRTLQSLTQKLESGDDLSGYITYTMIPDTTLNNAVWLQAVETALTWNAEIASDYTDRLKNITEQNRYLLPQVLAVWQHIESPENYLQRISDLVDKGEPLSIMFVLQSLNVSLEEGTFDENLYDQEIRSIIFEALEQQDRGVAYTASFLLRQENLFDSEDFDRINQLLDDFSLPGDIEVYQAFGSLFKERFEQQAKAVIDSLAALDYTPLNRSLADAGWDVKVSESPTTFRMPDWQRLWELGREPVLTLRTESGSIQMQLNPLVAPATVSMIDSLSRAGAFDGVPFHRVVPNFVIQGGDIERKDGFGGPDFVIPTEASDRGFVRGAVGIASAGPDTEGSQYFIMHQWMPHLNGNYTRFGKVIDGMDVVNRIQEGDKVISTTWY